MHTPGPWAYDRAKMDEGGHYHQIDGPQDIGNFPYTVADTLNRHHCISPEEDAANARLIAAAPELFAELQAFVEAAESWHNFHNHPGTGIQCDSLCARIGSAKAAIAKAWGDA